jgi:hypothetical protein
LQESTAVGQPSIPSLRVAGISDIYDKGIFGPPMDGNELPRVRVLNLLLCPCWTPQLHIPPA